MKTLTLKTPVALAMIALAIPGLALASVTVGDTVGVTEADIRTALTAQGYEITEIEFETDEIEVEAIFNGQMLELEISPETGLVIEIEAEDDDSDDDDDADGDDDTDDS